VITDLYPNLKKSIICNFILLTSIIVCLNAEAQQLKSIPFIDFKLIKSLDHDPDSFTQGLDFNKTYILESTGLYGKSSIRKYSWPEYKLEKIKVIDSDLFGEGITQLHNKIWQLTWKKETLLSYDPTTFNLIAKLKYKGQGWGLTHNNKEFIMSDGGCYLQFRDPVNFSLKKKILVHHNKTPQYNLNDISYINNIIYANVYLTNTIVRINARSGEITGKIDLSPLKKKLKNLNNKLLITNGITSIDKDHLLITGKNWDKLFLIKIIKNT
jgi:glutaminyl-peptide cyclotransferase